MAKQKFRRQQFVNPKLQGAFLLQLLLHWGLFLTAAVVMLTVWQVLSGPLRPVREHMAIMWERFQPVGVVLVLLMPAFLLDSIKLSHRVAGPMVRLRREFQNLAAGKFVAPVRFRDKDFFHEVADDFNKAVARIALDYPDRRGEGEGKTTDGKTTESKSTDKQELAATTS